MDNPPLSGLRILDLSESVSGPYCTRLLALHGAEVIKIENPDVPDISRRYGQSPDDPWLSEMSSLFSYLNMNKKGITLNWDTCTGYDILKQLAEQSDVLVENQEPGTFDYQSIQAVNPSIIITSISYFGQNGPYSKYKGSDIIAQAIGGLMKLTGLPGREPLKISGPQAEYQAGLNASIAIISSLFVRDETGIGDHIDISVMECLTSILEGALLRYEYNGTVRERAGARHPTVYPSTILPCKDGLVHVDAGADWDTFTRFVDIPELYEIEPSQLRERADEIDELLMPWLAQHSKDEIFHHAQEWRLPFTKVMGIEELPLDPQFISREFFFTIEDGTYPGAPFKMNDFQPTYTRVPSVGEHNYEVFSQLLGYAADDLVRLRGMGVV